MGSAAKHQYREARGAKAIHRTVQSALSGREIRRPESERAAIVIEQNTASTHGYLVAYTNKQNDENSCPITQTQGASRGCTTNMFDALLFSASGGYCSK